MQYTLLMVSVTTLARLRQGDDAFKMGVCSIESCVLLQEKNKGREREDGKKTEKVKRSKYKRWTHTHTKSKTKHKKKQAETQWGLFYENNSCLFPFSLPSGVTYLLCLNGKQRYVPGHNTSKFFKRRFSSLELCIGFYLCTFLSGLEVFFSTPPSRLGAEYPWAEGKAGKPLESEGGAALLLASEAWAHHSLAACREKLRSG